MNDTATPVYRPTKNCIWNSFQSSGKRHLILTGERGSGKSTLLQELTEFLCSGPQDRDPAENAGSFGSFGIFLRMLPGISTWAEPGKAVYLRENSTGKTVMAGFFDASLSGTGNRMRPLKEGFRRLGAEALNRCADAESEWCVIDEIGYLEADCPEYCEAVRRLMERKRLAAVVRRQELPFLTELRQRPDVFCVDLDRPFGRNACVIMASGLGMRFGGNKLLEEFEGKTLIERSLQATEGIFERRVVVTRHQRIEELCRVRNIPVVRHSQPFRSDTVRLGLEAVTGEKTAASDAGPQPEGCLFCPADQPLLRQETVASLAVCAAAGGAEPGRKYIWRAAYGERAGSPVLFPAWAFEELKKLPEGQGGSRVIRNHAELVRLVSAGDMYELEDVDRPEDLERLRRR